MLPEVPGHFWIDDDVHSDQFASGPAPGAVHSATLPARTALMPIPALTAASINSPAFFAVSTALGTPVPQGVANGNYSSHASIAVAPNSLSLLCTTSVTIAPRPDLAELGSGISKMQSGDMGSPTGAELIPIDNHEPNESGSSPEEQG